MGLISGIIEGIPKILGGSSIKQRAGLAAMYLGVPLLANKFIENYSENRRAYYGDSRYDSIYGGGAQALESGILGVGLWGAANAIFDRDPLSRIRNSYRYTKARVASTKFSDLLGFPGFKPRMKASSYSASDMAKLKGAPRFGKFSALYLSTLMGANPGALLGMVPHGTMTLAAGVGAGYIGAAAVRHLGFAETVATAAGAYAGYKVGSSYNNISPEGNIVDFRTYNADGVSRMNFSTAGLSLALHSNNRRY